MNPILEVKDLAKNFPEVRAVDGISFSIEAGTCFGLLGPNGAGKTTAIEVIEGILQPTAGEIFYKGKRRGNSFKNEVGIQFQNTELPQFLTVKETLLTFRDLYDRRAEVSYLIETCRLEDILKRDNRKISGGQKQRLLLAMALANDPELLFLDEPTTGLDPQARRHLWDIVRRIKSMNRTIVLTTHYMEEAEILCDYIGIIDHGKIIAMGTPRGLLQEHCAGVTITLRAPIDDAILRDFPCQWFRKEDHVEIQTASPNECLYRLVERGVDLSTMNVRNQNLEDLFLKLTGHELRA
ncbi:MAG TPA: ABC transporter ATP-binding protein [Spirochaetota bacterium]|nr:ABC transporter ATP-binding protein [Spirochaetota bacterium]